MAILSQRQVLPEQDIRVSHVTCYSHIVGSSLADDGARLSTSSSSLSSVAIRRLPRHSRPLLFIPYPLRSSFHSLLSLSLRSVYGMGIQFGSFNGICQTAALVICPLIGSDQGIEPSCYSRNVDIAGTLIFQPCEFFPILRGVRPSYPHIVVNLFFRLLTPSFPALPSLATCFVHVVAI
jgi:hypothetical protein